MCAIFRKSCKPLTSQLLLILSNANDGTNANNNNTFRMHINKQLTLQKYPRPSYLPSSGYIEESANSTLHTSQTAFAARPSPQ